MLFRAAIIAHYDSESIFSDAFLTTINLVADIAQEVIIVTTSPKMPVHPLSAGHLRFIHRPNVGYDFYSYKVGFNSLSNLAIGNSLLFLNSSIEVTDKVKFKETCINAFIACKKYGLVSATVSKQINVHMQSYFFAMQLNSSNFSKLRAYLDSIRPLNTKQEIIWSYEFSLISLSDTRDVRFSGLYKPSFFDQFLGMIRWIFFHGSSGIKNRFNKLKNPLSFNPSLALADKISEELGFVKQEALNLNPYKISGHSILENRPHSTNTATEKSRSNFDDPSKNIALPMLIPSNFDQQNIPVAVVIHAYYFDVVQELLNLFSLIKLRFIAYVTTPFEADVPRLINLFSLFGITASIHLVPNEGRDVAPFLRLLRSGILDKHQVLLKLHTKKSKYHEMGAMWRKRLYEGLLPSTKAVQSIYDLLQSNAGMIGGKDELVSLSNYLGSSGNHVKTLSRDTGILVDPQETIFFAGTMFWCRVDVMSSCIKKIPSSSLIFEKENGQQDGTLAHAFERIFLEIFQHANMRVLTIDGLHFEEATKKIADANSVPVLS